MIKLVLLLVVFLVGARLIVRGIYGPFIFDKIWQPVLECQIKKGSRLNMFNSSIIQIGDLPTISNISFGILGYYYIEDIGIVPRGSKCHKLIKSEFEKLKKEKINRYLK